MFGRSLQRLNVTSVSRLLFPDGRLLLDSSLNCLNATVYLHIISEHLHPFMTSITSQKHTCTMVASRPLEPLKHTSTLVMKACVSQKNILVLRCGSSRLHMLDD